MSNLEILSSFSGSVPLEFELGASQSAICGHLQGGHSWEQLNNCLLGNLNPLKFWWMWFPPLLCKEVWIYYSSQLVAFSVCLLDFWASMEVTEEKQNQTQDMFEFLKIQGMWKEVDKGFGQGKGTWARNDVSRYSTVMKTADVWMAFFILSLIHSCMCVFIHAANIYWAPSFVLGTLLGIRDKKVNETQPPNLWRFIVLGKPSVCKYYHIGWKAQNCKTARHVYTVFQVAWKWVIDALWRRWGLKICFECWVGVFQTYKGRRLSGSPCGIWKGLGVWTSLCQQLVISEQVLLSVW